MRNEPKYRKRRAVAALAVLGAAWAVWAARTGGDVPEARTGAVGAADGTDAPVGIGSLVINIDTAPNVDDTYAPSQAASPPPVSLAESVRLAQGDGR